MQEHSHPTQCETSEAGAIPLAALGSGRLRDSGWAPVFPEEGHAVEPARTQVLHQWALSLEQQAAGLLFLPLDGNPRHGVLALFVDEGELHGAIEIVERQGRWLVMPDDLRARSLAVAAMAQAGPRGFLRSSIAGTPDRRFIFFNTLRDGATATLVERRRDGGVAVT
ncbi:MAG: hypothetical protein K2X75_00455 [Burkholderiaceae bacterium]|jgi:hypothetical protein|nr:hypothetical protein [Burkholderiaceae bacterium]